MFLNAKKSLFLVASMMILIGCSSHAVAPIVSHDSFCDSKYSPAKLSEAQIKTIEEIRRTKKYRSTIDALTKYWATNAKEYKACK